ncbi:MAG: ferridoxin [Deltaproteobacteria bacterium]|nr:MAG: ferridoxin [Deltaproteobacteria bacterium]
MSFLNIDESLCTKCMRCVSACPRGIVSTGGEGFPRVVDAAQQMCLICGHCVAVCPERAASLAPMNVDLCPEVDPGLSLNSRQVTQLLRSRRSIRCYKDKPVERETLKNIIETARYAPTAANLQQIEWTVVEGQEKLKNLAKLTVEWMRRVLTDEPGSPYAGYFGPIVAGWEKGFDPILREAPVLVTASSRRVEANVPVDISIALAYLEIAALPVGLGTCWAGLLAAALTNDAATREALGLPKGHFYQYPMMLGYPKYKYQRLPERKAPVINWR